MKMYFSASQKGFYDSEIHGESLPADVVEITMEQHQALLDAQGEGKVISADEHGMPFAMDRPPLSEQDQIIEFNADVIRQIETIERERQPRAMRDFLLNGDKTRLEELNAEIAALRATLK